MTQQNAALVEESAAASESMKAQVKNLKEQTAFFKTADRGFNALSEKSSLTAMKTSHRQIQQSQQMTKFPQRSQPPIQTTQSDSDWEDF